MTLSTQIRDLVVSYSAGNMDVSRFRDEFLPLLVSSNSSDGDAFALALNIESTYGEYIEELIDETEFRSRIAHFAPTEEKTYIQGFAKTSANKSGLLNIMSSSALHACASAS